MYDPTSGTVTPAWTAEGEHPKITPEGRSLTSGSTETPSDWTWRYLGKELTFDASGACTKSGYEKTFRADMVTGALEIIGNLASKTNMDNDTLTFTGKVTAGGVSAVMEKSIEVVIAQGGASSYYGRVWPRDAVLSADVEETELNTELRCGGEVMDPSKYTVTIYKTTEQTKFGKTTVKRADVDGTALFIAKFAVGGEVKFTDVCTVVDIADDYSVKTDVSGSITDDKTAKVTVTGTLVNARTLAKAAVGSCTWTALCYRVSGELNNGETDVADGTFEPKDITERNSSTEAAACKVYVTSEDSGESDLAVLFDAEFAVGG